MNKNINREPRTVAEREMDINMNKNIASSKFNNMIMVKHFYIGLKTNNL